MKIYYKAILLIGVTIFFTKCNYQRNEPKEYDFPILKEPYLGQKPPGISSELFAPQIISTSYNEAFITISPKGNEIFYGNVEPPISSIIHLKLLKNQWCKPQIASFSGKYKDGSPMFSPDGKTLYFSSNRPLSGKGKPKDNSDIWLVQRTIDGWSTPQNLGNTINSDDNESGLSITKNRNLYFVKSLKNKYRTTSDIYCAKYIDSEYKKPEKLGDAINTKFIESDPFIAVDESYLIFTSDNGTDFFGWMDLYISFKRKDGSWTKALNLGETVNTDGEEFNPFVSFDGKYLFFNRHVKTYKQYLEQPISIEKKIEFLDSPGNGLGDIYWIDAGIIEKLKSESLSR